MKVLEIRSNSIKVEGYNGQPLLVARYEDENGIYFLNENLEKQYTIVQDIKVDDNSKKHIVIKELPDADVGTEVIWDDINCMYKYKKKNRVGLIDTNYLNREEVLENTTYFCDADHYPEYYGFHYPVLSRKDVLDLFKDIFDSLTNNTSITHKKRSFDKCLRNLCKEKAEEILKNDE
jgi:hypothetical protein